MNEQRDLSVPEPEPAAGEAVPTDKPLWRQLGPGLITAAVVVGPGTITVSSKIGAEIGTGLVWALILTGSFMMLYTSMAARIGILNRESILTLVSCHYGRWLGVLVGFLAFAVTAGFQSSNYIACSTALESVTGVRESVWMWLVGAAGLLFVIGARQLYRVLEKVMMGLVGVMVLAFIINLAVARPNPLELATGLIPRGWPGSMNGLVMAMVATTFSVIAALYQSTLAQQKGWHPRDRKVAVRESCVGISTLVGISLIIMWTSATVLPGKEVLSAADLSRQLQPALGDTAVLLFSLGFLAAGFSSTIVNAMIGGGLLADGFGLNANLNGIPARCFTAVAMAVGLAAGFYLLKEGNALGGIVVAQKSTVLTVPLVAIVLILLANNAKIVGTHRNSLWQNVWAGVALLVLLGMSLSRIMEMLK